MEEKQFRIGGTDAPAIMGDSKWENILGLWQIKTGRKPKPDLSKRKDIQLAKDFESLMIQIYLRDKEMPYDPKKEQVWVESTTPDGKTPIVGYLDYQIDENTFIEMKSTGQFMEGDWEHGVPDYYKWQVVHYFACNPKLQKAHVVCFFGIKNYVAWEMNRDEDLISTLMAEEEKFADMVYTDTEPQINIPPEPIQEYPMDEQVERLTSRYLELSKEEKVIAGEKDTIKKAIQTLVGTSRRQESDMYKVTYFWVYQNKVNSEAIYSDYKVDLAKYTTKGGYYRLDVKEK